MLSLYKLIGSELHYWETWDAENNTGIIHWGKVGETGKSREIKSGLFSNYQKKIKRQIDQKIEEGYAEFEDEKTAYLEIEFIIDGFGTEEDLEKRHRLEYRVDEVLGWTGLGYCDGGSTGSGTMEVGCVVVDFDIAKKIIENNLTETEFSNYSRIFRSGEE